PLRRGLRPGPTFGPEPDLPPNRRVKRGTDEDFERDTLRRRNGLAGRCKLHGNRSLHRLAARPIVDGPNTPRQLGRGRIEACNKGPRMAAPETAFSTASRPWPH